LPVYRAFRGFSNSRLLDFAHTVAGAFLLSVCIMAFALKAFTVDGPSMMPTIRSGERLLVDRLTYRLRSPRRGEVVVFRVSGEQRQLYIKRVIGVPGDTIVISDGRVYINGIVLDEPYLESSVLGNFGPYAVPKGHVFVLGDNRNNSEDSRTPRVGFVAHRMILGRALWRYWPLTRVGSLEASKLVLASS
jgi:signal peptidase I